MLKHILSSFCCLIALSNLLNCPPPPGRAKLMVSTPLLNVTKGTLPDLGFILLMGFEAQGDRHSPEIAHLLSDQWVGRVATRPHAKGLRTTAINEPEPVSASRGRRTVPAVPLSLALGAVLAGRGASVEFLRACSRAEGMGFVAPGPEGGLSVVRGPSGSPPTGKPSICLPGG